MNYGLICLIMLQFCLATGCLFVLLRLLNIKSALERGQVKLETDVAGAVKDAVDIRRMVEALELSHYKAIQARQHGLETEVAKWTVKVDSLVESQQSLSAKLASREKLERKAENPKTVEVPAAVPSSQTMEDLIAAGLAVPLANGSTPPARPSRSGSFGVKLG